MRIGEFADVCRTKVSVLRHYDKEGLLIPNFIDPLSGYRHYTAEQIEVFEKISALKKAGFSLQEIRQIMSKANHDRNILAIIEQKKRELEEMLKNVEEATKMLIGVNHMIQISITDHDSHSEIKTTPISPDEFQEACILLDDMLKRRDYQRISEYKTISGLEDTLEIMTNAVKLKECMMTVNDNVDIPFEEDERVIGKWKVIGEFAVKEDFSTSSHNSNQSYGDIGKEIYFLPNGERYWCYGWTKGYFIFNNGNTSLLNSYEIEERDGQCYMFMQNKSSYYYRKGGVPTVLVLQQLDRQPYTRMSMARKDNINMPFVHDERVLGKWTSLCYCPTKDDFIPGCSESNDLLYFRSIEFQENGSCITIFENEEIASDQLQVWTKNYLLRKYNQTACEYEIQTENGIDYLMIEWKSGDYIWGGFDTTYYVFVRANA